VRGEPVSWSWVTLSAQVPPGRSAERAIAVADQGDPGAVEVAPGEAGSVIASHKASGVVRMNTW
jgi:hypothetical protein